MTIGAILSTTDRRAVLTPDVVQSLKGLKVDKILLEQNLGMTAGFRPEDYTSAGGVFSSRKEILSQSDILLSVQPLSKEDLADLKKSAIVIAALNPFMNKELMNDLKSNGNTSFAMELIPRTTRAQSMDILSSQATVAGYKAVLTAANTLPKFFPMFMTAAGSIKPAKVLILGAGVAGLQAIATSRKLGAVVEAFDVRSAVKEEVQSLGAKFVEVEGARDEKGAGGYAVEQTEEFKQKQQQAIHNAAAKADVVICTAQIPGRKAPLLIKKETVAAMNPGSVIVDLAASTGGNCELTQNDRTVVEHGVTIIGKSDFPSDMPADASRMFSKNCLNFMKLIIDKEGNMNLNFNDDIVHGCCLTRDGELVHEGYKKFVTA